MCFLYVIPNQNLFLNLDQIVYSELEQNSIVKTEYIPDFLTFSLLESLLMDQTQNRSDWKQTKSLLLNFVTIPTNITRNHSNLHQFQEALSAQEFAWSCFLLQKLSSSNSPTSVTLKVLLQSNSDSIKFR